MTSTNKSLGTLADLVATIQQQLVAVSNNVARLNAELIRTQNDIATLATAVAMIADTYVSGPASSTSDAIARFDSMDGKSIANSTVTISDDGKIAANSATIDLSTADTINLVATNILANGTPIPSTSGFLPLSGGTLTGPLTLTTLIPSTSAGITVTGKMFINGTRPVCSGGYSMTTNPSSLTNTITETPIVGTGAGSLVTAPNILTVGAVSRAFISGTIDTTGSPTITFRVYAGASGTTLLSSFAIAPGTLTLVPWRLESMITCRVVGSGTTGKLQINSFFVLHDTSNANTFVNNPLVDFDTTVTSTFRITAQWSVANPGNILNANTLNTANFFFS